MEDVNNNKTFFLVPGWRFPEGSIQLGTVIRNPAQPHDPIFTPAKIDSKIWPTDLPRYERQLTAEADDKHGLFFRFVELFGVGAEANVQFDRRSVIKYAFGNKRNEWFLPSETLKTQAATDAKVKQHFRDTDYDKPVYMITGLETVTGASVTVFRSSKWSWRAFFGLDAGPVSAGPQSKHNNRTTELIKFKKAKNPMVFAFQLMELRMDEEGAYTWNNYTKGALLGADEDTATEEPGPVTTGEVTSEGLKDDFGDYFTTGVCVNEGQEEECAWVAPRSTVTSAGLAS